MRRFLTGNNFILCHMAYHNETKDGMLNIKWEGMACLRHYSLAERMLTIWQVQPQPVI